MAREGKEQAIAVRQNSQQTVTKTISLKLMFALFALSAIFVSAQDQTPIKLNINEKARVEAVNLFGKITVVAALPDENGEYASDMSVAGGKIEDVKVKDAGGKTSIQTVPVDENERLDIILTLPPRTRLRLRTGEGEIAVSGNFEVIEADSLTGTIAVDVPTDELKYQLNWTAARPRFLSDIELEKVREGSGGKFSISGKFANERQRADEDVETDVRLELTTSRGIILINIPPNEVTSDLRERPLTDAAKAVIRSGDSLLMDAIRRASPKYFGEYARTLPPAKRTPQFSPRTIQKNDVAGPRVANVRITDQQGRAVTDIDTSKIKIVESGEPVEIVSIERSTAPYNLVLLVDVSGSVDNYVNFIRKTARKFVETVDKDDKVSMIIFNDDVKVLSKFTSDKQALSQSLDTFDAGGATAYYDALAFTIADTLRPLKGERTAVVILTDGDDNRSFLPFQSILGSIQESGSLVYPVYIPSALVAAEAASTGNVDPLRQRYMSLNTRAEGEGEKLAEVSGGVFYKITMASELEKAYLDISSQLRASFQVTYRAKGVHNSIGRTRAVIDMPGLDATIVKLTSP